MRNRILKYLLLANVAVILLLGQGCSNLRYLEQGQELYTGSRIQFENEEKIPGLSKVESELESVMRPEPNAAFMGLRIRLWLFNVAGEPTGRGLRYILKNRFGRPPVLFGDVSVSRTSRLLENRLRNLGFFDAYIHYQIRQKNQRASVNYTVSLRPAYTFSELIPLPETDTLSKRINETLDASLIKPGDPYQLQTLRQERERIDRLLKRQGFFYFHPDHIIFLADTTIGGRKVEVRATLKPDIPPQAARAYQIGSVYVFADYLLDVAKNGHLADTIKVRDGLFLVDSEGQFSPATLANAIFFRRGEMYNVEDHDRTLNHLLGLGVFKFVNIRFEETTINGWPALDVRILLTPAERKSLSAEVRGVTKSNNFAGPGLNVSFSNRNAMGGAEQFRFTTNTSLETLIARDQGPATSVETGLEAELILPRFIIPFKFRSSTPILLPRTSISLGFNYLNRTDAFNLSALRFRYGFSWNQRIASNHRLSPIVLNWFALGNISENLGPDFIEGELLRRGLFEQFIIGSEYSLTYNSQLKGKRTNDWYFNLNLYTSGNLARALFDIVGAEKDEQGSYRIFGQNFSQYFKADFDLRWFNQIGRGQRLATRFIAGVGIPYGNSQTLLYVKQFTIGGSKSIRAFHPRTLGPGAFKPPDSLKGRFNIYQSGEVKLELNLEYRFDITRLVKGAFFIDAGNVWRLEEDEKTPGGQFKWSSFYEQIAVGAGTGLRFDANFFVLRFDFAFPLLVPWDQERLLQPFKPFSKNWRQQNLIFNLGIGYPF